MLTTDPGPGCACWFHHRPYRHLPATASSALPPDLGAACNARSSSRNPTARNSATPLSEMPNAHDAFAHLAGACRIRTSHVRLLQMRSRRKNRYSVRSNEVRRCWLARWRIAAANVGCASNPTPQGPDLSYLFTPVVRVSAGVCAAPDFGMTVSFMVVGGIFGL